MGFDLDEDILQDFLVEAGEILELLQEQLKERLVRRGLIQCWLIIMVMLLSPMMVLPF